jgi:oligoribonuclease NrnB/cAMP/cGMP phosphodiesterase (DHH superfamily)
MKIIYHADCIDGFTAAWCAWREYGDAAEYIPARYGEPPPDVKGHEVLIVDFSYPRDTLIKLWESSERLRVLDHHKTAEADLAGLDFCTFDMNRSGAGLTCDVLGFGRSHLVNYVEDRDLWRWALSRSKEVSAWLATWDFDFRGWSLLDIDLATKFDACVSEGEALLRGLEKHVKGQVKNAGTIELLGRHEIPIINCTYAISEVVGKLAEGALFAAGWFQRQDGKFVYSLRSRGDFDVSEVAKHFGGGGHKNAAGFTVEKLVHQ